MRLEIDIAEHHYNNIMALDSVSLGRVPYKGIIMYSINAIKHGKVLEQEPTTKNEAKYCDRNICLKNEYNNVGCEDCEVTKSQDSTTKNDLGVDCVSRETVKELISAQRLDTFEDEGREWANIKIDAILRGLEELPSVTPQEPKTGHWVHGEYCSECGCDVPAYIIDWKWQKDMDAKYCPNCGAKMESEADNG